MNSTLSRLLALALLLCFGANARAQEFLGKRLVTPSLVADTTAIAPGKPFTAGVVLKMAAGWHTYWQFSGDSGAPTKIDWELPAGFVAGPIQWPIPTAHPSEGDQLTYIYEGEVMLMVEITPPAELPPGEVALKAKLRWLVCAETCIPGDGEVALTLPSGAPAPANAELFSKWRAQLPKTSDAPFAAKWELGANEVKLQVTGLPRETKAEFFPLPPSSDVQPGHPKAGEPAADGARTFSVPFEGDTGGAPWQGVVVTQKEGGTREGWVVTSAAAPASTSAPPTTAPTASPRRGGLLTMLWFAFLGGLILNLMPCVLPVIALKIFGFVQQAGQEPRRVFHLGLAFVAGVFVFFLALAGLAIGLRAAGHGFFWGMQFADPRLLLGLIALVVLFALAMFGVFEITLGGAENTLGAISRREGASGAFVHGLFTTLLGTSCTAPFVGPVLGFAVTQPPPAIVAIFLMMAAGMALPYFLLTWHPAWMRFLPKPGAWMERFKQLMGFVLLGVAVWLLGVFGTTRGVDAMTAAAWFLTLLALGAWIFGAGHRRWWAIALALIIVIAGGKLFLPAAFAKSTATGSAATTGPNPAGIVWEPFSEKRLEQALGEGRPVFIDFTAEWCVNCKTNEKLVINTERIGAAVREKKIVMLKADWTDFDAEITKWLKKFDRIGVPLYVLYPGGNSREPIILPEILTQTILLSAFSQTKG